MAPSEHPNESGQLSNAAVPLPRGTNAQKKPVVWHTNPPEHSTELPPGKCVSTTRTDGICCKDLNEEERTLIDPDVVRDVVIGLSDGLTVPFALAAGLSSLGTSRIVVMGGIAELIAGAISMGIGGFLGSQAERDHYRYQQHFLAKRVTNSCSGELERGVLRVLGPVGVDERTCRSVTECLKEVEENYQAGSVNRNGVDEESARQKWASTVGLTAFLLKFELGLEEVPNKRMYISAFTIGMGYLMGGIIPLIPYFFIPVAQVALIYSSIITGIILLIFGAVKARVTGAARSPADYVWGAASTLMVGGVAAAAAFGIVRALESNGK